MSCAALDTVRYNALVDPAQYPLINMGSGEDLTIRALAEIVAKVVDYQGSFVQDISKPDGTMRKIMDITRIKVLGWKPATDLETGIALSYKNYLESLSI